MTGQERVGSNAPLGRSGVAAEARPDEHERVREGVVVVRRAVDDLQPGDLVQHYSTWEQTHGDPIRREVVEVGWVPASSEPTPKRLVIWRDPDDGSQYETRESIGTKVDVILRPARERDPVVAMPFEGDYDQAVEWCGGQNGEDHGSPHAAMVDLLFSPPEDYEDVWMRRLWEVGEFVRKQPCKCTPDMVEDYAMCDRCALLNVENSGR